MASVRYARFPVGLALVSLLVGFAGACGSKPLPKPERSTAAAGEAAGGTAGAPGGGAAQGGDASDCPTWVDKFGHCVLLGPDGCPPDWHAADGRPCMGSNVHCSFEDSCDDPDVDYAGGSYLDCNDGVWRYHEEDFGSCLGGCRDSAGGAPGAGGQSFGDCG